jgi:hypothetical protein
MIRQDGAAATIHHAFQESRSRRGHYGFYHVSFGEGYYLPDTSQYIVFTYKTEIFTFERGGFRTASPAQSDEN